ncbi:MAG: TlpA disulfide reductase family protein [Actinomycetota bacterium]|nr:TlpA disulfide reductase family protein [Actinomycetota bacterium]
MSSPRLRVGSALAVLLLACASLTACANSSTPSSTGGDTGFVAGDGSIVVIPAAQRTEAPDFTLPTLDGSTFTLSQQLGKVVVMNVWASWCAPCRAEAPELQLVWEQEKDKGVQFVGLDTRDSATAAQAFVNRFGLTYPQAIDTDGRVQLLFRDTLPAQAIPSTLIVDAEGKVAARFLGATTAAALRNVIDDVRASTK